MALQARYKVTIYAVDKLQSGVLSVEFWTSKGFTPHNNSYNQLVFRSNNYGSMVHSLQEFIFGSEAKPWSQVPMELTMLCQELPQKTTWNLVFRLPESITKENHNDFIQATTLWCDEFTDFCRQWVNNTNS